MKEWKGHPISGMIIMPKGFNIHLMNTRCDVAQGHCACGGFHDRNDWVRRCANVQYNCGSLFERLIAVIDLSEETK